MALHADCGWAAALLLPECSLRYAPGPSSGIRIRFWWRSGCGPGPRRVRSSGGSWRCARCLSSSFVVLYAYVVLYLTSRRLTA